MKRIFSCRRRNFIGLAAAFAILTVWNINTGSVHISVGNIARIIFLRAGDELAVIHAADEKAAEEAERELLACYTFADAKPQRPPFIRGVVT